MTDNTYALLAAHFEVHQCKDCATRERGPRSSYCNPCRAIRQRTWKARHYEAVRARRLADYAANPDKYKASTERWGSANIERRRLAHRARARVRRAIARGILTRALACEWCHATDVAIEGAHFDYSRPLEVTWLCRVCHRRADRAAPKTLEAA